MTHHADATSAELEFERLRLKQRRHGEPPTIEMLIGDWYSMRSAYERERSPHD